MEGAGDVSLRSGRVELVLIQEMNSPVGEDHDVEIEIVPPGDAPFVHAHRGDDVEVPLHHLSSLVHQGGQGVVRAVRKVLQPTETGVYQPVLRAVERDHKGRGNTLNLQERHIALEARTIDARYLKAAIEQSLPSLPVGEAASHTRCYKRRVTEDTVEGIISRLVVSLALEKSETHEALRE